MNIQSSFTVYTAALHALILNPLLFAYYWLGLSWSDLEWLYLIKTKLFISKNKQQETLHQQQAAGEAKHSAENTINFSLPQNKQLDNTTQQHKILHHATNPPSNNTQHRTTVPNGTHQHTTKRNTTQHST